MPPTRTSSASQGKRPRPPFNPPRPRKDGASAAPRSHTAVTSRQAKAQQGKKTGLEMRDYHRARMAKEKAAAKKGASITVSSDEESENEAEQDPVSEEDAPSSDDNTTHSIRREGPATTKQPAKSNQIDENKPPPIPQKLLTRLLYDSFEDKNMKIGREAMNCFSKYMETFVREALARAVYERQDADGTLGGDGFLQVEDLEKLAPQLLLDF